MTKSFTQYEAPEGTIWVCAACGKTSSNRVKGRNGEMWNESCFLHAVLCVTASLTYRDGRVVDAAAAQPDTTVR